MKLLLIEDVAPLAALTRDALEDEGSLLMLRETSMRLAHCLRLGSLM